MSCKNITVILMSVEVDSQLEAGLISAGLISGLLLFCLYCLREGFLFLTSLSPFLKNTFLIYNPGQNIWSIVKKIKEIWRRTETLTNASVQLLAAFLQKFYMWKEDCSVCFISTQFWHFHNTFYLSKIEVLSHSAAS